MATAIINTKADGTLRYSMRANLGGKYFGLEFTWNARDSSWWLQLSDSTGALLGTRKLVCAFPLFATSANPAMPYGDLVVVDLSGNNGNPGLQELGIGQRCVLTFTDAGDFLT